MLQNLDKILNSLKYSFIVAVSFFYYKGHQSNWTGVPRETHRPPASNWQT
jgi:hypothetical protein